MATKEEINVQIKFWDDTKYGEFCDAIYISKSEYDKMTTEDIEELKQVRIDKYVDALDNPPAPVEKTSAQIDSEIADLESQILELEAKKAEIDGN